MKLMIMANPQGLLKLELKREPQTNPSLFLDHNVKVEDNPSSEEESSSDEVDEIADVTIDANNKLNENNKELDILKMDIQNINEKLAAIQNSINNLNGTVTEFYFNFDSSKIQ